jgi:hypothetical protein
MKIEWRILNLKFSICWITILKRIRWFFNEENVEMLNQFKRNKHTFSIDGVGKTYEYIRYPAIFGETEESVKRYIKDVKNSTLKNKMFIYYIL